MVGDLERRGLDLRRGRGIGGTREADRGEAGLPELIDGEVVGDLEQPAREFELRGVAIDVVERFDERVLRQLLGRLAVADHPVDKREHGTLVPADQLAVRRFAPLLREDDDIRVR